VPRSLLYFSLHSLVRFLPHLLVHFLLVHFLLLVNFLGELSLLPKRA
jgi:hypothetical protein